MERRLIILKTFSDTEVGEVFTTELSTQVGAIVKQCCKGKSGLDEVFVKTFPPREC